jgi:integrase
MRLPSVTRIRTWALGRVERLWSQLAPRRSASEIVGHSSVAITQQVYAHLHPDAFAEDYSRVAFAMPDKAGVLVKLRT